MRPIEVKHLTRQMKCIEEEVSFYETKYKGFSSATEQENKIKELLIEHRDACTRLLSLTFQE